MPTLKTNRLAPGYEPIRGYTLDKRIGRGGYGEVWQAEAPGGLKKAVKFVYGQQDERRASQELKSLERIKGVQHPFILTLERFELIENQLVIVTELADGSLEDVFKDYTKRGSCGIPREALLGYMKDIADALDYLHQLYKLQHLDIKPANLLMVGGRVKVADFGLLKDLADIECSLVGGLTPIYAPPEVFDGRPSIHSDQYSLAVMYQELLTGTRPFSGRTIAQLATQHVHNAPNLKPLPASDRPCVARALEKTPERRFESCSEFVTRLVSPHGCRVETAASAEPKGASSPKPVENLPQIEGVSDPHTIVNGTQTLVVALGGTGADCLSKLRDRMEDLGVNSGMTLHSVLIDTDPMTTQLARMIDDTPMIPRCRVVDAELRSPNDYRSSRTERLRSISRRWIYNVPRNRSTGGMRPLGRLALIDHADSVYRALREAVDELKTKLSDGERPKVYVVGSLTGGSGSGMYIDVVYLLRHLLDESALESESVVSLLTTNRFQGDPSRPLALHATKSAISEFTYFLKPGNSYPGDGGVGWPSVPAARTPLNDAYLIAESDRPDAPSPVESVVNYLWLDATVAADWFSRGRSDDEESTGIATTRSLSVVEIGDPDERKSSLLAPQMTRQLLFRWLGNPAEADQLAGEFTRRVIRRCYLEPESLINQTEHWFGSDRHERRNRLTKQIRAMDPGVLSRPDELKIQMQACLRDAVGANQHHIVCDQIKQHIEREINLRLQDARMDLSASIRGLEQIRGHLSTVLEKLNARDASEMKPAESAKESESSDELAAACDLGEAMIREASTASARAIVTDLDKILVDMIENYTNVSARIAQAIQMLKEEFELSSDPWCGVDETLREKLPEVLDHLHDQHVASHLHRMIQAPTAITPEVLVNELAFSATGLIRAAIHPRSILNHGDQVKGIAGTVTMDNQTTESQLSGTQRVGITAELNGSQDAIRVTQTQTLGEVTPKPALSASAAVDAVRPPLLECGGKHRIYLICRDKLEEAELKAQLPNAAELPITTILARTSMPMLVHEAQSIELKGILSWLDALTGDDGKISARLATRCDVDWS